MSKEGLLDSDSAIAPPLPQQRRPLLDRQRLGRFRLLEKLGEGGMGAVYRAEDGRDGTVVAIKVLKPSWIDRPEALRRFQKEARLLAEVNNPYVTRLLEVNEADGIHYLVLEFVAGKSLGRLLGERTCLDERSALALMADVARALVEAHRQGIVHRDVKPENILLVDEVFETPAVEGAGSREPAPQAIRPRVKLSDFGLARHVVESLSLELTRPGMAVGTPYYMAPEQASGRGGIDPRTDVYAMGATLFHLLAGRPPFQAADVFRLVAMHCNEPPPLLQKLNPALSDGACRIVARALSKDPAQRHADGEELLRDLEELLRGEPTRLVLHPQLPQCDPDAILAYEVVCELQASPAQLWPHVSNTERFNRAIGLPAVRFTTRSEPGRGVRRFGALRKGIVTAAWEEHPFEWIEGRRMGVLREFSTGPFAWMVSVVELTPRAGGGTTLRHEVRVRPRGLVGRLVAAVEVGFKARRAFEHVYHHIDAALCERDSGTRVDLFEAPATLPGWRRRRLEGLLGRLVSLGLDPAVVETFGDFLAHAPAQEVARIRPLALARRLELDAEAVVTACLHGAREGLLVLLWDVLCPLCRIPAEVKDTLRLLREHGHCEACGVNYEVDFASSVELIFRIHPEIRAADTGTYCVGGPAHFPHVAAQVRLAPAERTEMDLELSEGAYRLCGPQLPHALSFRVEPSAAVGRWEVPLARGPVPGPLPLLRTGRQVLVLSNDHARELLVRVERTAPRQDALTAARASSLVLFRELFPGEILSPGQLVSVTTITALATDLEQTSRLYEELGDARAFAVIHEHFRRLQERIGREGGAVVRTAEASLLAVFSCPAAAVRVGLDLQAVLGQGQATGRLRIRAGIHRGPALAATLNDRLDYFGATVSLVGQLPSLARGGELIVTEAVVSEPQVAALLRDRGLIAEPFELSPGLTGGRAHRLKLPDGVLPLAGSAEVDALAATVASGGLNA